MKKGEKYRCRKCGLIVSIKPLHLYGLRPEQLRPSPQTPQEVRRDRAG